MPAPACLPHPAPALPRARHVRPGAHGHARPAGRRAQQCARCAETAARNSHTRAFLAGCRSPADSESRTSARCGCAPISANRTVTTVRWPVRCAAVSAAPGNTRVASNPAPGTSAVAYPRPARPSGCGCRQARGENNRAGLFRWRHPMPSHCATASRAALEPHPSRH